MYLSTFKITTNPLKLWFLKFISNFSKTSGWQTSRSKSGKITHVRINDTHHLYLNHKIKATWARLAFQEVATRISFIDRLRAMLDDIDSKMDDAFFSTREFIARKLALRKNKLKSSNHSSSPVHLSSLTNAQLGNYFHPSFISNEKEQAKFTNFYSTERERIKLTKEKKKMIANMKKGSLEAVSDRALKTKVNPDKVAPTIDRIQVDPKQFDPLTEEMMNAWPIDARERPAVSDTKVEQNAFSTFK